MGMEDYTVQPVARPNIDNVRHIDNLAMGYNADGTPIAEPFMGKTELALMGGMGGLTLFTSRGQFGKPLSYGNVTNLSSAGYGRKVFAANFRSFSNFNNMEFIDTHLAKMEGIMAQKMPKLPEGTTLSTQAQAMYDKLLKAKSTTEYTQIINQNGGGSVYNQIKHALGKEEIIKLRKLTAYNQMYGDVLQDFRNTQNRLRSGGKLQSGEVDALHKKYADARVAENEWLGKKSGKGGKYHNGSRTSRIGAKMSAGTKRAMAGSKFLRRVSRGAGKAGGVVMIGMSLVGMGLETYAAVSNAKKGEGLKDGARQVAKSGARAVCELGGAWAGMKAGAMIGSFGGPVGAAIGGLVGSFVGWAAGSWLANKSEFMRKSVVEEKQEEQNKQNQQELETAIANNDLDKMADYIAEFIEQEQAVGQDGKPLVDQQGNPIIQPVMEQVLDEKGQPVLDENGQPVMKYKYITVSEDPEKQKEFEDKVSSLTNYVETEYAKQQRAEELRQQAEEARQKRLAEAQAERDAYLARSNQELAALRESYENGTSAAQLGPVAAPKTGSAYDEYLNAISSKTTSWRDPVWQTSLGTRYDRGSIYDSNRYQWPTVDFRG